MIIYRLECPYRLGLIISPRSAPAHVFYHGASAYTRDAYEPAKSKRNSRAQDIAYVSRWTAKVRFFPPPAGLAVAPYSLKYDTSGSLWLETVFVSFDWIQWNVPAFDVSQSNARSGLMSYGLKSKSISISIYRYRYRYRYLDIDI
jgi:hypothetical protein